MSTKPYPMIGDIWERSLGTRWKIVGFSSNIEEIKQYCNETPRDLPVALMVAEHTANQNHRGWQEVSWFDTTMTPLELVPRPKSKFISRVNQIEI